MPRHFWGVVYRVHKDPNRAPCPYEVRHPEGGKCWCYRLDELYPDEHSRFTYADYCGPGIVTRHGQPIAINRT